MEEFAKKKGKEMTRGPKLIAKENAETIHFYRNMILGANGAYLLLTALMGANYQSTEMICLLLCGSVYFGCFQFMLRLGKATTSEPGGKGVLIDPGLDLNMKEGMAEHVKDAIILTAIVQSLAILTNYAWFLLLLAPARLFWMAWTNFISPWLFAPAPEEEVDEKKQKKMERKMKRGR